MQENNWDEKILSWLNRSLRKSGFLKSLENNAKLKPIVIGVFALCLLAVFLLTIDRSIEANREIKHDLEDYQKWMSREIKAGKIGERMRILEKIHSGETEFRQPKFVLRAVRESEWRLRRELIRAPIPRTIPVKLLHLSFYFQTEFKHDHELGHRWWMYFEQSAPWGGKETAPGFFSGTRDADIDINLLKKNYLSFYKNRYIPKFKSLCDDFGLEMDETRWKLNN